VTFSHFDSAQSQQDQRLPARLTHSHAALLHHLHRPRKLS